MRKITLVSFLSFALLTSCNLPDKSDHLAQWRPDIRNDNMSYEIKFGPKRTQLSREEKAELKQQFERFESDKVPYARIYIDEPTLKSVPSKTRRRLKSAHKFISSLGIKPRNISVFTWSEFEFGDRKQDTMIIMFENRQLLPRDCPNWNQPVDSRVDTEGEVDFGCANAFNISRMVADRSDLIQGRELTIKDSAEQLNAVKNYQKSKVKDIKNVKSSTTNDTNS